MGPTVGALDDAVRWTVRRPRSMLAVALLGWLFAVALGGALWGLIAFGRNRVAVPMLALAVVGLTAVGLAVGNAVLVSSVRDERESPTAGSLGTLTRGLRENLPTAGPASLLLVLLVVPATVAAGLLAAALLPNVFLRTSHGTGAGATALAYLLTFEPSSFSVVATVLLGDWLSPHAVHATVATVTLIALTPVRFTDAAAVVEDGGVGLVSSVRTVTAHPRAALGYGLVRIGLLGTTVALGAVSWAAGGAIGGVDGTVVGVALGSVPGAVVAFPLLYRFHLGWYESARASL